MVEGQALPPNAQLGTVGRTGYALNPHLELEVHVGYSDSAEPHHHLTPTRAGLEVYIGPSPGTQVVTRIDPGVYVMILEDWATASVKLGHPGQMVKVRIPSQWGWEDGWVEAEHLEFTHTDAWLSLIWFEPDILFDQVAIPGPTPTPPLTTPTPTTTPTLSNSPTSTSTPMLTLTPIMSPTDRLSPSPTATSATRGYPCSATIADSLANMLNVVRSYPSTTAPFQEPVRPGQAIIVLTKRETPSDTWYQVANLENNVLGWIVAEYLVFSMDCPE
ncbi:MAG: hypothetical protein M5R40_02800 [Anaerolineae bacterium]|nr:hypothetical protein [Anaerolineae bacterium]